MKDGFINYLTILEMLNDNPLEQLGSDVGVPHALGINHDNGTATAYAEAWGFAPFDPRWSEEEVLPLKQ